MVGWKTYYPAITILRFYCICSYHIPLDIVGLYISAHPFLLVSLLPKERSKNLNVNLTWGFGVHLERIHFGDLCRGLHKWMETFWKFSTLLFPSSCCYPSWYWSDFILPAADSPTMARTGGGLFKKEPRTESSCLYIIFWINFSSTLQPLILSYESCLEWVVFQQKLQKKNSDNQFWLYHFRVMC